MREIRDAMFTSPGDDELCWKDDNCTQMDLEDILNLQESPRNGGEEVEQKTREKFTSMVILRAPPGSTIENLEKNSVSYVQKGFDNILSKPSDENGRHL